MRESDLSLSSYYYFMATPMAYGSSQARGWIGAVAASLHPSHSNSRPELQLRPTPQLTANPDPQPTEQTQGSNPHPHGCQSGSFPLSHNGNSGPTSLKTFPASGQTFSPCS